MAGSKGHYAFNYKDRKYAFLNLHTRRLHVHHGLYLEWTEFNCTFLPAATEGDHVKNIKLNVPLT